MKLLDYMDRKLIFLDVDARSKEEAIAEVVRRMKENKAIKNEAELLGELNNRETQGGTSLGNGVAIPHARLASLDRIVVAMARLTAGVNFNEGDREPVRLIFILVTPADKAAEYLKVLAKLAKALRGEKLLEKLFEARSAAAAYEMFEAVENGEP